MVASPCSLDVEFADQIVALLAPPSLQAIQEYYDEIKHKENCHSVRIETNKEHGKANNVQTTTGNLFILYCALGRAQDPHIRLQLLNLLNMLTAISLTILRYRRLKKSCSYSSKRSILHNSANDSNLSLLLEAWKPIAMGFKRRWWDCIALPDDVDAYDEILFRKQIRDLAYSSLQLLKEAIFDIECAPLFSLEIYGHIIGMFELNNLDLVVASPVEDYFIYVDDLPSPEKEEAEKLTHPFLDALGDDYSVCCQGSAFFPIQSCMNHSCCPNAKAFKRDEDKDGQAVIIAARPIFIGDEITISYIDENLPYEERQALLADYGFKCNCPKCRTEQSFGYESISSRLVQY